MCKPPTHINTANNMTAWDLRPQAYLEGIFLFSVTMLYMLM